VNCLCYVFRMCNLIAEHPVLCFRSVFSSVYSLKVVVCSAERLLELKALSVAECLYS
jgi:hypothetical protein